MVCDIVICMMLDKYSMHKHFEEKIYGDLDEMKIQYDLELIYSDLDVAFYLVKKILVCILAGN